MSEQEKKAVETESVNSKSDKKAKPANKKKEKLTARIARWFKDLKGELKKVTWPSAKDTFKNVAVVILCVLIVGVLIWVFDAVVKLVVEALLKLFN